MRALIRGIVFLNGGGGREGREEREGRGGFGHLLEAVISIIKGGKSGKGRKNGKGVKSGKGAATY